MVVLGGGPVSYERGTPVPETDLKRSSAGRAARVDLLSSAVFGV